MGQRVFEYDWEFNLACFESIDWEFIIFLGVSGYIENSGSIDENWFIFNFKFPIHVEPLWSLQPIFDRDIVNLILFGFAVDVKVLRHWRRSRCSCKSIHQGRSIRNGEEQGSCMFFIFYLRDLLIFSHGQRIVYNLIVSLSIRVYFNELFSPEIIILAFIADGCLNFPRFGSIILQGDFLGGLFPDHAIEFQFLNGVLGLRNAFSNKIDIERFWAFNGAFDFELDVIIRNIRMESHIEEKILMW